MFPYPLGVLTLLQGLYSLLWIVILMDVLSPTFDLREISSWSAAQVGLLAVSLGMTTFAVGVVMQTVSRNLFRKMKDAWDTQVLTGPGMMQRLGEDEAYRPSGAPSLENIDGDSIYNTWGYVKPKLGSSTSVVGPFGTCPANGVFDPSTQTPNRLHTIGPCDLSSGISAF